MEIQKIENGLFQCLNRGIVIAEYDTKEEMLAEISALYESAQDVYKQQEETIPLFTMDLESDDFLIFMTRGMRTKEARAKLRSILDDAFDKMKNSNIRYLTLPIENLVRIYKTKKIQVI